MMVSIVVPAYNEQELVCLLLEKLLKVPFPDGIASEIIVIDDGSSDGTAQRIEDFIRSTGQCAIRFARHPENRGKGAAVRSGFELAQGEILVVQDADLEYDPQDIPQVIDPILTGRAKAVYGSRILREKELGRSGFCGLITGKHPHSYVLAYLGGVAITKFVNLLAGSSLTDEPTCYKCFHRDVIGEISFENDDFAWEPELTMKVLHHGIAIHEVPISYHPRKMREGKKINWKDGVKALWTVWQNR